MIITEHLNPAAITTDLKAKTKEEALKELTELLIDAGEVESEEKDNIMRILLEREKVGTTGVGYGVAIPHGRCDAVKDVALAIGCSKKGVDFDSLDGKPVHLLFLLVACTTHGTLYLKILARISRFIKDRQFRDLLTQAESSEKVYEIVKNKEKKDRIA
ncbi:MAG TPA: PTS sugar transporter subunit IIA [Candidatus Omnitrophica bacterium]|nr:PTS sugar transporter subunit IIA [Candidatus Omnitrophota bacterium]